jgi:hypothetical protein
MNRYDQTKRADAFPNRSVTLKKIDGIIISHLTNEISPTIVSGGQNVKVPVVYGSPERWVAAKKNGFFRDQNGKIQKPVIMIKRNSFSKNEQLMSPNRHLTYTVEKIYNEHNQYDTFSVLNRTRKEAKTREYYNIVVPDYITLSYEIMIWTDTVEENNSICEVINFATEDYWGANGSYRFRTEASEYSSTVENSSEQERVVRTALNLTVYGYLLPDRFENGKDIVQKNYSPKKIIMKEEVVSSMEDKPEHSTGRDDIFFYPNKNKKVTIKEKFKNK